MEDAILDFYYFLKMFEEPDNKEEGAEEEEVLIGLTVMVG